MILDRMDEIYGQVASPIGKIHAVTEQVQVLSASLVRVIDCFGIYELEKGTTTNTARLSGMSLAGLPEEDGAPNVSTEELQALEESVGGQIEELLHRLQRFEATPRARDRQLRHLRAGGCHWK